MTTSPSNPPPADRVDLTLTVDQVQLVLGALGELPHRVVADLVAVIIGQATNQPGTDSTDGR